MSSLPIHIQLGLFGGFSEIVGTHVVSAHTRVAADGSETFVSEHLRWNRGRSTRVTMTHRAPAPTLDGQVSLFAAEPRHDLGSHRMPEVEVYPGAVQLPLWAA